MERETTPASPAKPTLARPAPAATSKRNAARRRRGRGAAWLAGALTLQAAALLVFIAFRLVDADEGIFLHAARLVRWGGVPYHDFFYMQMPYLPYAYAPVAGAGMEALFLGRLLSGALSLGMGLLVYFAARRLGADVQTGLVLLVLFGLNALTLAWHSTVKTPALADASGLAGAVLFVMALGAGRPGRRTSKLILAGFFFGLAANVRLTHAVLLLAAFGWVVGLNRTSGRQALGELGLVAAGALAASLGSLWLFVMDPYTFVFDNLVFRQVWAYGIVEMDLQTKAITFAKFALYPQNLLLLVLVGLSVRVLLRPSGEGLSAPLRRAGWVWISFGAAMVGFYLAISPMQLQYFGQAVPYLALGALPALAAYRHRWQRRWVVVPGAALYALAVLPFVWVFLFAAREKDRRYALGNVRAIVETVRRCAPEGGLVMSTSPHLPVLAERRAMLGLEVGGFEVMTRLDGRQREASKLLTREAAYQTIRQGRADVVAYEEGGLYPEPAAAALSEGGYRLVQEIEGVRLYARDECRWTNAD